MNHLGERRFRAFSAGSYPAGQVNPFALQLLQRLGFDSTDLRSKSWDEFSGADAPEIDFVFTVCDSAAAEECPVWPGQPVTAHWGIPDPAAVTGRDDEKQAAFNLAYRQLTKRIESFMKLPLETLDADSLSHRLDEIGHERI